METELYLPVKAFLESLDFAVKGEIGGCDVLALREGEPPVAVICELKQSFNLELVLQGVDRAGACDEIWLAARLSLRGKGRESEQGGHGVFPKATASRGATHQACNCGEFSHRPKIHAPRCGLHRPPGG